MNTTSFLFKHPVLVILGHYGSGKTNLALNCALHLRRAGRKPTLVDLDVVNPYFRSTDYQDIITAEGITVAGPIFGNSNLDAPSLAPGIDAMITRASLEEPIILDVGGDPDGARALARYVPALRLAEGRLVVMVVNLRRPETRSIADNMAMLQELEKVSSLTVDGIIGNTHLAEFTTAEVIRESLEPLQELSRESGLPLIAVTVPQEVLNEENSLSNAVQSGDLLPVQRLVKTVWQ